MSLLNAVGGSPLLSLVGWTVVSAFTLGAAAAALVLLCRSVAPRLTAAWQHRLVLALYALSLACGFAVAAMPRKPATAAAPRQPMFGLPVAGAVLPVPPGPSALTTNTSRVDLRVAIQEAVGVLGMVLIGLGMLALGRLSVSLWVVRGLRRSAMPSRRRGGAGDGRFARRPDEDSPSRRASRIARGGHGGDWRLAAALRPATDWHGCDARFRNRARCSPTSSRTFDGATSRSRCCRPSPMPGPRSVPAIAGSRWKRAAFASRPATMSSSRSAWRRCATPALEALGQWSRGVQVTNVVCAANRHLADRVRRLLEGSPKPSALPVLAAVVALCAGALATTLVAAVAPGLPVPPAGGHRATASPMLLSSFAALSASQRHSPRTTVSYYYDTESPGPFRISAMTLGGETVVATVTSVYPKRMVALALGLEARRVPLLSPDDQFVMRASPVEVVIDPGNVYRLLHV